VQPGDSEDRALVLGPDAVQRGRVVEQRRLAWTAHYRSHTAAYGCQISRILREIPHFRGAARRSAANAGNVMLTAELTRLNTDLGYFLF